VKFFFDNCMSPKYVEAWRLLADDPKHVVTHLASKYDRAAADTLWIPGLAAC